MLKKWKTLQRETVYSAKPYLEVIKECVETERHEIIDDFYTLKLRSFALCIPVLPDGNFLTLRQYKHGASQICMTFPAGHIEDGEEPDVACTRELLEETGYEPDHLTFLGSFVDNGNQRGCIGYYYLGQNCIAVQKPQSGDLEEMEIEIHSSAEIDKAVRSSEVNISHHALGWYLAREYLQSPNALT